MMTLWHADLVTLAETCDLEIIKHSHVLEHLSMVENRKSRCFFAPNFRKLKNWWPCDWRYNKFAIIPRIVRVKLLLATFKQEMDLDAPSLCLHNYKQTSRWFVWSSSVQAVNCLLRWHRRLQRASTSTEASIFHEWLRYDSGERREMGDGWLATLLMLGWG